MSETPTFLRETRGWNAPGLSFGEGMYVEDVDMPLKVHRCGKCMNPFTREGNPECPRREVAR